MAGKDPSNHCKFCRVDLGAYWGIVWALLVAGVVAPIVVFLKSAWRNSAPTGHIRDPSVVIGTFITLYVFFIGGFGVLVGFIVKRSTKGGCWEAFRVMTIAVLAGGAGLDLWRVLNSTGDLFTAATSELSYRTFNDTIYDFKVYFFVNVFVVVFSIVAIGLLSSETRWIWPFHPPASTATQSTERSQANRG